MSDPYEGITRPDPERERLFRSVFQQSTLEEAAEAISVATEQFHDFYVGRRSGQYQWSFATQGGPYPLLRITARFLKMDPQYLAGVGSRVIGDWCVQIVPKESEPDAWTLIRFEEASTVAQVRTQLKSSFGQDPQGDFCDN